MAIQVTGSLTIGHCSYNNPQIQLVPHLTYRGSLTMDAHVAVYALSGSTPQVSENKWIQVTTIPYYPATEELSYPTEQVNPYSDLIVSLEQYVINQLSIKNAECTFNTF